MTNITPERPSWLELESVRKPPDIERITSLSWETIKRAHPNRIIKLSQRREGMKLKDALAIASGE